MNRRFSYPSMSNPVNVQENLRLKGKMIFIICPINRKRKEFERQSIEHLLSEKYNISTKDLIPKPDEDYRDLNRSWDHYLFIDYFDNEDYDCRTPSEWLSLGQDGDIRKPVPAIALLPVLDTNHDGNGAFFS